MMNIPNHSAILNMTTFVSLNVPIPKSVHDELCLLASNRKQTPEHFASLLMAKAVMDVGGNLGVTGGDLDGDSDRREVQ